MFKNALDCIELLEKYYELKLLQNDHVPTIVALDVGCYLLKADKELENARPETPAQLEMEMVNLARDGINNCLDCLL